MNIRRGYLGANDPLRETGGEILSSVWFMSTVGFREPFE
jgi:hypothetical protein